MQEIRKVKTAVFGCGMISNIYIRNLSHLFSIIDLAGICDIHPAPLRKRSFLMQVEIETVASIIHSAKKPVMTIKPMAAGRTTPYVGLNFSWNTIRPCDMVTVGCTDPAEAAEDIEISRAALEHRFPNLEKRASPNQNQDAFGGKQA